MRKPMSRLGLDGPEQVKEHSWFNDFPWDKLNNRELESPYLPNVLKIKINIFKYYM